MSQLFTSGGQSIRASVSVSVLPKKLQGWFPLGLTGLISLLSKGLSRPFQGRLQHRSSKESILQCSAFFMVQILHLYLTTGEIIAVTMWTFVSKVMALVLNMLSRFVIVFFPRSKCLFNFMAAITIHSDFGAQENKICHCCHFFPIYLLWSAGTRWHDLIVFWMWSFKPAFHSLLSSSSKLFSSSSLSAIMVVSFAYLRLVLFLLEVLIPAWDSPSPIFSMMYSA